jgi:peptidoglycan/LPS O-acetylase OafA/YrhL
MGTIRLLLALAVVMYHSYSVFGLKMTGGMVSVQTFYMLSGFYMALILNEKYTGAGSWRVFITNRMLRLYPIYWAVLILTLVICLIGFWGWGNNYFLWTWFANWESMHFYTIVILVIVNLFLFGSDWLFFSAIDKSTGLLQSSSSAFLSSPPTYSFLAVPQSWSIGAELSFYLLAPFLVRRHWWLQVLIVFGSFYLRYWMGTEKFRTYDPWTYRYFPHEIALFLLGSLMYPYYVWLRRQTYPQRVGLMAWLIIVSLIIVYGNVQPISYKIQHWVFYGILFCLVPFVFHWSKDLKWDRFLGEFSYPVYICHLLVIMLLRKWFFATELLPWYGIISIVVSLLLAFLLTKLITEPIERFRQKRARELNTF